LSKGERGRLSKEAAWRDRAVRSGSVL